MALTPGARGEATLAVTGADLATALAQDSGDAYAPVFATARMVGLMEVAASRAMRAALQDGEVSVGVSLEVAHRAATPLGSTVTAEATLVRVEAGRFTFEVVARDDGGEIGRGTHVRAIVTPDRLVRGARRRCEGRG
jgi:predicted thioesterase